MKTSDLGIQVITHYEGLRLKAYLCPANVLTIGYGHTGPDVTTGLIITEEQAKDLLKKDLILFEKSINDLGLPLQQHQFDALVSLVFNIGFGNFKKSTLLKRVIDKANEKMITDAFMMWNKAKVKGVLTVLDGLTKRRLTESILFNKNEVIF
jgi:lysozyme